MKEAAKSGELWLRRHVRCEVGMAWAVGDSWAVWAVCVGGDQGSRLHVEDRFHAHFTAWSLLGQQLHFFLHHHYITDTYNLLWTTLHAILYDMPSHFVQISLLMANAMQIN